MSFSPQPNTTSTQGAASPSPSHLVHLWGLKEKLSEELSWRVARSTEYKNLLELIIVAQDNDENDLFRYVNPELLQDSKDKFIAMVLTHTQEIGRLTIEIENIDSQINGELIVTLLTQAPQRRASR